MSGLGGARFWVNSDDIDARAPIAERSLPNDVDALLAAVVTGTSFKLEASTGLDITTRFELVSSFEALTLCVVTGELITAVTGTVDSDCRLTAAFKAVVVNGGGR